MQLFNLKVVVNCGPVGIMHTRWIAEACAQPVIALEFSHAVDNVICCNLWGLPNVDIVQFSIEQRRIKGRAITGMVLFHKVIQHATSIDEAARALWSLMGEGGEFMFNAYPKNDHVQLRKARLAVYKPAA